MHHPIPDRRVAEELATATVPEHFGRLRKAVEYAVMSALRERDRAWIARIERATDGEKAGNAP